MAKKVKFREKIVVVHARIRELEQLYYWFHRRAKIPPYFEISIPIMALRHNLNYKERVELAKFEVLFWERALDKSQKTKLAQNAAKKHNDIMRKEDESRTLGVIPRTEDIRDIVANTYDGGQNCKEGQTLKRMLVWLQENDLNRWLDTSKFKERNLKASYEWAQRIIDESMKQWEEFKNFEYSDFLITEK